MLGSKLWFAECPCRCSPWTLNTVKLGIFMFDSFFANFVTIIKGEN